MRDNGLSSNGLSAIPEGRTTFTLTNDPAITGLRAIAVIAVLLFHLGIRSFGGGYVGVDIFFVISGYLITHIILHEIEQSGTLDLKLFYVRRVRRLLPALFVTLCLTFAAAASMLSVEHFSRFANSLLFAAFSTSNLLFWYERGYFDVLGDFKPLLHTWSLGVEMQFYFVWPFLLLWAWRSGKRIVPFVLAISVLSAAANLLVDPANAFFLTPFRMFEFGVGALTIWASRIKLSRWLEELLLSLGLLMILAAVLLFRPTTPFPSYNVFLPVFGAMLVIWFGRAHYVGAIVRNRMAVGVGLISYSLYLVHWPLITLFRYWKFSEIVLFEKLLLAAASLALATISYFLVEEPFRSGKFRNSRRLMLWAAAGAGLLVIFSVAAHDGWPWRFERVYSTELRAAEKAKVEEIKSYCRIENGLEGNCNFEKRPRFLVLGDSHLRAWSYAFTHAFPDVQFVALSYIGCHQAFDVYPDRVVSSRKEDSCSNKADFLTINKEFLKGLDGVILASYRPYSYSVNDFRFALIDYVTSFSRQKKAVVLGNYFQTRVDAPCGAIVARRSSIDACLDPRFISYVGTLNVVKSEPFFAGNNPKHDFVDITEMLCPGLKNCPTSADGVPALVDSDHLTHTFAEFLLKKLRADYRARFIELRIER